MKKIIILLLVSFNLQSCSEKLTGSSINNTKWTLTEWPQQTLPVGKMATLNFNEADKISGKSFCNGFGGIANISGNSIKFDQLLGTMMFCEDVGTAEKLYLDGLKTATSFKVTDLKLRLYKGEVMLMEFSKMD